jgi:hypothetical protein
MTLNIFVEHPLFDILILLVPMLFFIIRDMHITHDKKGKTHGDKQIHCEDELVEENEN